MLRSRLLLRHRGETQPAYRRFTGLHHACDECILIRHEGHPGRPAHATFTRTTAESQLYLCTDHAAMWRRDDHGLDT